MQRSAPQIESGDHETIDARIGTAEEREQATVEAAVAKSERQFERRGAAGAITGDDHGTRRMRVGDCSSEVRGKVIDSGERRTPAVEPRRLQRKERLVGPQMPREGAIRERVARVASNREDGRATTLWLQRHDRTLSRADGGNTTRRWHLEQLVDHRRESGRCGVLEQAP